MKGRLYSCLEKLQGEVDDLITKRGRMSATCICFPKSEPPRFWYPKEQEIASRVKCPIHGERFERREHFHCYPPLWLLQKRYTTYISLSEQYRRAWAASFPHWPHRQEDDENVYLVFPDGRKYIAWPKADPWDRRNWQSRQIKGPDEQPNGTDAKNE